MSAEEDTELRDLVAQTLETNGVLGKIRAQLRANVFLALEEQETVQHKSPFLNKDLKQFINTREGRVVTNLVREFLEYFKLDYALAVFEPETNSGEYYEGRNALARDLDIIESAQTQQEPLLAEVVKRCCTDMGGHRNAHPEDMSPEYLEAAKNKFDEYDHDQSGSIDKDELRELFCDIFPDFNRNMLDRYVNDEFRAYDKDFSNSIDFEEFLDMYKRLFVLHKSRVSEDVHDIMHSPRRGSPSPLQSFSPPPPPLPDSPPPVRRQIHQSSDSNVETMNKKNLLDSMNSGGQMNNQQRTSLDSPRDLLTASDNDDDSFFDSAPPQNDRMKIPSNDTNSNKNGANYEYEESPRPKTPDTDRSVKDIDKKMSDLGLELPDDDGDYDDDFENSKVSSLNKTPRSNRSALKSARSDSTIQSIEEDIDDFEDEISGAMELLKSDASQKDDLTTDRTVSPHEHTEAFDYVEEIAP